MISLRQSYYLEKLFSKYVKTLCEVLEDTMMAKTCVLISLFLKFTVTPLNEKTKPMTLEKEVYLGSKKGS